jgi:hypothetical protein
MVDLADAIEESRKLSRRLCVADYGLSPDEVYSKPLLDVNHLLDLKRRLESVACKTDQDRANLTEIIFNISSLSKEISSELLRPTDDELCKRFTDGTLDARTVMEITGWSVDELDDNCQSRGLNQSI